MASWKCHLLLQSGGWPGVCYVKGYTATEKEGRSKLGSKEGGVKVSQQKNLSDGLLFSPSVIVKYKRLCNILIGNHSD